MLIAASWKSIHVSTLTLIIYPPQINTPHRFLQNDSLVLSLHPITTMKTFCLHLSYHFIKVTQEKAAGRTTSTTTRVWTREIVSIRSFVNYRNFSEDFFFKGKQPQGNIKSAQFIFLDNWHHLFTTIFSSGERYRYVTKKCADLHLNITVLWMHCVGAFFSPSPAQSRAERNHSSPSSSSVSPMVRRGRLLLSRTQSPLFVRHLCPPAELPHLFSAQTHRAHRGILALKKHCVLCSDSRDTRVKLTTENQAISG